MVRTKKPANPPPEPEKPEKPGKKKGTYTFTNVSANHTIHVTFERAGGGPKP
jgi:hypothetical protein